MTYSELFEFSINKLNSAGISESESDVRLLFFYLLDVDRGFMFMHGRDEIKEEEAQKILTALELREKRIPLQHITGKQNFMGIEFNVGPDVLIPRFDTETLVEEAMLVCGDGAKVLDVCTGSGCILISLMKYKNNIQGIGCDISDKALELARKNARLAYDDFYFDEVESAELCKPNNSEEFKTTNREHDLSNPRFIKSDLFGNITDDDFDLILSNPPYIRSDVIPTLMPEVKDHDPMLALDGGEDGLIFYRKIAAEAKNYLKKGGYLLVEIGHDQGNDVSKLFCDNGYLDVKVIKDLSGNDRVVRGIYV